MRKPQRLWQKKKGKELNDLKLLYADSLYRLGKIREAALSYNELLSAGSSKGQKVKLQLRLGDCFRRLGDKKAALLYYKEIVKDFPESSEAASAREQLAKLKSKH